MADIKYSVEVAYFQSGKLKNPVEDSHKASKKSLADYDRAVAKSFREGARLKQTADRQEQRRRNAWDRHFTKQRKAGDYQTERRGRYGIDGVTGVGSALAGGFGNAVDTMGGMLITGLTAAAMAAGTAIFAGLSETLKTGIDFADTIERAEISMAAMAKMQLGGSWEKNKMRSRGVIEGARQDAAVLPGEMEDILGAMKTLGTPGMQSGMGLGQVEKMSATLVAMAEIEGMTAKVASTQLARILQGRMTGNNNFGLRLGITDFKKVNKMDPKERADMLAKMMEDGAAPALDDFKGSWKGLTSTIKDNWKNVARSFSQPLVDHLKAGMTRGLDWFGKNEHAIHMFATNLGVDLLWAFQWGERVINRWKEPVTTFATHLKDAITSGMGTMGPFIESMSHTLESFLMNPKAVDHIVTAAKLMAGFKLGSVGVSAAAGSASLAAPFMKMLGVGAEGGALSLGALAPAMLILIPVMATFGLCILGIADIVTDTGNKWNKIASLSIDHMKELVVGTAATTSSFSKLWDVSQPLVDLMGIAFLKSIEDMVTGMSGLATAIAFVLQGIPGFAKEKTWHDKIMDPNDPALGQVRARFLTPGIKLDADKNMKETEADRKKRIPQSNTTIHKVEIHVQSNQDPFRVARATLKVLNDVARNPKVSRDAPGSDVSR